MSSSKPSSRRRSPSSRTSRDTRVKEIERAGGFGSVPSCSNCRMRVDDGTCPHSARRRPGVAITKAGISDSTCSRCLSGSTPPITARLDAPKLWATSATWKASSRVGSSTKARGKANPTKPQSSLKLLHSATFDWFVPACALAETWQRKPRPDRFSRNFRTCCKRVAFFSLSNGNEAGKSSSNRSNMPSKFKLPVLLLQRPSATRGNKYARVLPEPVGAIAMTSWVSLTLQLKVPLPSSDSSSEGIAMASASCHLPSVACAADKSQL
mmetsp:Transcript_51088/g.95599  ORF Transcript_51088/g.95599 Transcript_51088/m.95599 type:complete len:267 (-) Transcript_51088:585-1385(-)